MIDKLYIIPNLNDPPTLEVNGDEKRWLWLHKGVKHRVGAPAVLCDNGAKEWWYNGKLHRTDGPAIEQSDGSTAWWVNGQQHRGYGPAIERADGSKEWINKGKRHRDDGPAVVHPDGSEEFWIAGRKLSVDESKTLLSRIQQQIAQQKSLELVQAFSKTSTKGRGHDVIAPTTARFKPKVRP